MLNTKKCYICKRPNDTLHWHRDPETGDLWVYCVGQCQRGYGIYDYCNKSGISLSEFLKADFAFEEAKPNEVNKMEWPSHYISLSDPRAARGLEYIKSRGIDPMGDIYYDLDQEAIVFPYYFHNVFVGAQIRFIEPKDDLKMITLPGSRTGLLFYNWNQDKFMTDIKGVIVTEGAFNTLAINQALNELYGEVSKNPWKCIACSGSGATKHQLEKIKELKDQGFKIIVAPDYDEAGFKMVRKFVRADAITHMAFTKEAKIDWNDVARNMTKLEFAKWFLNTIQEISACPEEMK